MASRRANFAPTKKVIVEILNGMFAHFNYIIARWQFAKYPGDMANFQLEILFAHFIFLLLKSLDAAIFCLRNFFAFSKRVFAIRNHIVPLLGNFVVLRRHLNSDESAIHLMRYQR